MPVNGFYGFDTVNVTVSAAGLSSSLVLEADVSHVNRQGRAVNLALTLEEDSRIQFALNATSLDEDPSAFIFVVMEPPPAWCGLLYQVDMSAPMYYVPEPIQGYNVTVTDPGHQLLFMLTPYVYGAPLCSFTYLAHDASNVSMMVTSSATVSFTVDHVNHAPVAQPSSVLGYHNEDALLTLSASDPDGDALSYYIDVLPSRGTLYQYQQGGSRGDAVSLGAQLVDPEGRLLYAPQYGQWGNGSQFDSLRFSVSDGQLMGAADADVAVFVAQRIAPLPVAWSVATNIDTDVVLTFLPDPSQRALFTLSSVQILSVSCSSWAWSLYTVDPESMARTYCSLPCTVFSVNGAAPSIVYSPPAGAAGIAYAVLNYDSYNGPVYTSTTDGLNSITVDVLNVVTSPPLAADREWCLQQSAGPMYSNYIIPPPLFNASTMAVRINSLPDPSCNLRHEDTTVDHPGGLVILSVPTVVTTNSSAIGWQVVTDYPGPWGVSFTYSLAQAPLYLYSPPATVRVYMVDGDVCDVLPTVDVAPVSVVESEAVTITLDGDGFDAWTVVITALPVYGQLFQANGSLITNVTQVTDPLRRVIYLAEAGNGLAVEDWFAVQGVSIKGGAGPVVGIDVTVLPLNSPPTAVGAWYAAQEDQPLLLTLHGWDHESNASLDAVITSLPARGFLYVCVNGSQVLNELIYTAPFALPAVTSAGGRAQVWFAGDGLPFSISTVSDVYAQFEYAVIDASRQQSLPATITLTVEEADVGPSVADIVVPVPPVQRSLIALDGQGDNAPWWAVVLTLPNGTLYQVEASGVMGPAISEVPTVVTHTQHLLLYQSCAACGTNDTFMYAAQSTATIAYSNVTIAGNSSASASSSSSSSSSSSTSAGYLITSSLARSSSSVSVRGQPTSSSSPNNSSSSNGVSSSFPPSSSSSSSALSSSSSSWSPFSSSPSSSSSSSSSDGSGGSSSGGSSELTGGLGSGGSSADSGSAAVKTSSSLYSSSADSTGSASTGADAGGSGNATLLGSSSSSWLGNGSANSTNSSSAYPPPRHYMPVITNLSATATATLLFTSPLPAPAVNRTITLNESMEVVVAMPTLSLLTQLPWHGALYQFCEDRNVTECDVSAWPVALSKVPTTVMGDSLLYVPPSDPGYQYGLSVNDWVLDYFLYEAPSSAAVPAQPLMVSFAVEPGLQAPTSVSMSVDVSEDGLVLIQLTYVSDEDASTLHAHILLLPQYGRLCQLVNVSQCGEVMYPTSNSTSDAVDIVVQDPDFSVLYVPESHFSGADSFVWAMQDSFGKTKGPATVNITVKHVNQPPIPYDVDVGLTLDSLIVPILLNATDSDQDPSSLTYSLLTLPAIGYLNQTYTSGGKHYNERVELGQALRNRTVLYSQAGMASAYPFPNFTFLVTDKDNASNAGVVSFSVSCSPGLVNNIFLTTGPVCIDCPVGAECSQSGVYSPFTQSGYWPSDLNTAQLVVYLPCQPAGACAGGAWGVSPDSLCTDGYTDRRCGTCASGWYKLNGACSSCPTTGSFWLTVMLYVLPSGVVITALLLLISKLRLEVTFFTIAINFFQLLSTFSAFQLNWPSPTHTLFSSVSFINFNVDLLSLECHFPGITYQEKWLACILFPLVIAVLMSITSYGSAALVAALHWAKLPKSNGGAVLLSSPRPSSPFLAAPKQPTSFSELLRRQVQLHHVRLIWAYHTFLVIVFLSLALKSFEMLKCTTLADGTQALDVEPSIRCDLPSYDLWKILAILSVCAYVVGIPLWLAYVMFRLRPPVNADSVCGGWLFVPRSRRRAEELRRQLRRAGAVGGAHEYRLADELEVWERKYSTLTRPFAHQYYYWALAIVLRNLIVAIVSIVCTTIPLYQACLTMLTLSMAVLLQNSRRPYRDHTGMNELELSSLVCAILILFLGILFFAELGNVGDPSDVLSWLTLSLVFVFCSITAALFVMQLRRSWRLRTTGDSEDDVAATKRMHAILQRVNVKSLAAYPGTSADNGLVLHKRPLAADSTVELAYLDPSHKRRRDQHAAPDATTEEASASVSSALSHAEHKHALSEGDIQMADLSRPAVHAVEEKKAGDCDVASVSGPRTPLTSSEDSQSRGEGEEARGEGARRSAARITSSFPAPLPILHSIARSQSMQKLSVSKAGSSDKRSAAEEDPQVWLIDHSRVPSASAARGPNDGASTESDLRHRRVVARWSAAINAVCERLRDERCSASYAPREMLVIGGASSDLSAAAASAHSHAGEPAVFVLKKRTAAIAQSRGAPWIAGRPAVRPTSPRPQRRVSQPLRRPSMSLSSAFVPLDSVLSEVSVLSAQSGDSPPSSPHSASQSHFVIPPMAIRHVVPPAYHHAQPRSVPAQLPTASHPRAVTLLLTDALARTLSASSASSDSSRSGPSVAASDRV